MASSSRLQQQLFSNSADVSHDVGGGDNNGISAGNKTILHKTGRLHYNQQKRQANDFMFESTLNCDGRIHKYITTLFRWHCDFGTQRNRAREKERAPQNQLSFHRYNDT